MLISAAMHELANIRFYFDNPILLHGSLVLDNPIKRLSKLIADSIALLVVGLDIYPIQHTVEIPKNVEKLQMLNDFLIACNLVPPGRFLMSV